MMGGREKDLVAGIKFHIEEELLLSIKRDRIDNERIFGFPVYVNDEICVMTNVFDFRDEGIVIFRTGDITDAYSKKSDWFYEHICICEGLRDRKLAGMSFRGAKNMKEALLTVDCSHQFVILQCEHQMDEYSFSIGKLIEIKEAHVLFAHFDGEGVWEEKYREIPISEITQIGLDSTYARMYYKYMNNKNEEKKTYKYK